MTDKVPALKNFEIIIEKMTEITNRHGKDSERIMHYNPAYLKKMHRI